MLTLQIVTTITYDPNDTSKEVLEELARTGIQRLMGNGAFTSDTEALVESWDTEIHELPQPD